MKVATWEFPKSRVIETTSRFFAGGRVVRPRRFELLTYSFGGCRSIQLSYGRIHLA
jgi:hypothetical protein